MKRILFLVLAFSGVFYALGEDPVPVTQAPAPIPGVVSPAPTMAPVTETPAAPAPAPASPVKAPEPEKPKTYKAYRECLEDKDEEIQGKCAAVPAGDVNAMNECIRKAKEELCGKTPHYDEVSLKKYNLCYRDFEKKIDKGCVGMEPSQAALCRSARSLHYCGQPDTGLLVQEWIAYR